MSTLPPLMLKDDVTSYIKSALKNSYKDVDTIFEKLLTRLGTPPLFTTLRINTQTHHSKDSIKETVTSFVQKSYEKRGWMVPRIYHHPVVDELLVIEGRGPNIDIKMLEREIVVDLACGMSVLRGADVFNAGIMGMSDSVTRGSHVSVYADVDGKCLRGTKQFHNGRKIFLGNGISQTDRQALYSPEGPPSGVGIQMTECLYQCPSLSDIHPELVFPQNLPSIICSKVLQPHPGEIILDMCAAPVVESGAKILLTNFQGQRSEEHFWPHLPGGKTCHIATLMKNKGRVVALDKKTSGKLARIGQSAEAWGLTCVEVYSFDSRTACSPDAETSCGPPYPPESFDRILLDAPCSALGQRPCSVNKSILPTIKSFPLLQRALIIEAEKLLKPGGTLVYSTCTITLQENEAQVAWALKTCPSLILEVQVPHLGGKGRPCDGLRDSDLDKLQYFDPVSDGTSLTPESDTIGFFIAKFGKK